jgi:hypothetical protein
VTGDVTAEPAPGEAIQIASSGAPVGASLVAVSAGAAVLVAAGLPAVWVGNGAVLLLAGGVAAAGRLHAASSTANRKELSLRFILLIIASAECAWQWCLNQSMPTR